MARIPVTLLAIVSAACCVLISAFDLATTRQVLHIRRSVPQYLNQNSDIRDINWFDWHGSTIFLGRLWIENPRIKRSYFAHKAIWNFSKENGGDTDWLLTPGQPFDS